MPTIKLADLTAAFIVWRTHLEPQLGMYSRRSFGKYLNSPLPVFIVGSNDEWEATEEALSKINLLLNSPHAKTIIKAWHIKHDIQLISTLPRKHKE